MAWVQRQIRLKARSRGFHLVTDEIMAALPEIKAASIGQLHLFLQHSSASLTLNENADPSVRIDMEGAFNRLAPENHPDYIHTYEGPDDMPAHIKSSLNGVSLLLPVGGGEVLLGVWQGVWLGEHRDHAGGRSLIATLNYVD